MGVSHGKATFIMVGAYNSGTTHAYGVIMASTNGLDWQEVYTGRKFGDVPTLVGSNVFGVVWDGNQFWAGAHEEHNGDVALGEVHQDDILLNSTDGLSWTEVGRKVIDFYDWPAGYTKGLLVPHCSGAVKDTNGNGVPDGIYGIRRNEAGDVLTVIHPTVVPTIDYLVGGSSVPTDPGNVVRNGEAVDVGIHVTCVANTGNIWVAGGGEFAAGARAASSYSFDDGITWQPLLVSGESAAIAGIVGAPIPASQP
jgi:hypothetical protein